jgi:acyl phosphate:glycerol-3-phosphate acyltransferase
MHISLQIILACTVGYLLGSISFATLICKRRGIDIFKVGSCNPGATNVKRILGKKAGNTVFGLDFLKGFIAALLPLLIAPPESRELLAVGAIISAIAGHSFSIFLRFRGGKGVATTMGGFLALVPFVLLIGALVWVIVYYSFRFVSLASILFGVSLPISSFFLMESSLDIGFCGLIAVLLIVRHKSNIQRLMNGTESRFSRKPDQAG